MKNLSKALSILLCFALIATLFVGLGTIGASANEVQPLGTLSRTNPIARSEAQLKAMIHDEEKHECRKEKLCESAYYENKALVVTNNINNNGIYVDDGVNAHYLNIYSSSGILTNTNKYGDSRVTYVVKYKVTEIGEGGFAQIGIGTSSYIETSESYISWNWSKTDIHGVSEKHTEASDKEYSIVVTIPNPNSGAHERLVVAGQGCKIEVSYLGRLATDKNKANNTSVVRMVLPDGLTYAMLLQPGSDLGTNIKPWGASTAINADFYDAQGNKLSYLATTEDITVYVKYENGEHCHVYDNECADDECNICKEKREIVGAHIDADEDCICDVCGNNSGIELPEVPACTHANTTTTNTATYFKDGTVTVVCDDCGETVSETEADPITDTPVKFSTPVLNPETNELTVKWEYSDALATDIAKATNKAVKVILVFDEKEYDITLNTVGSLGETLTLQGVNAERFNAEFSVKLEFTVDSYDTATLNAAAKSAAVKVSDTLDSANEKAEAYNKLIEEIGKVEAAVVAGEGTGNADFTAGASKVDIANGTAEIKFVATNALINELKGKADYNTSRTTKLVLTIGGKDYDVAIAKLMSSITVNISGLSFEQMYGDISVKLVVDYAGATETVTTETVTFSFTEGVNASELEAAKALEALLG